MLLSVLSSFSIDGTTRTLTARSLPFVTCALPTRHGSAPSSVRKGGCCGWEPSSSSNFSIRVFRAYPLIEIRQAVPCRAIRGNSNLSQQYPPPLLVLPRTHTTSQVFRSRWPNPYRSLQPFFILRIVRPRIFESKFRNHCAKKLIGALRKPTSFM